MTRNSSITATVSADGERTTKGVKVFGYLVIASSFMSYVPGVNIGTGIFVAALGCILLYQITLVRPTVPDARTFAMLVFVLYASASVFTLLSNGWGVEQWLRGVIPFLFFLLTAFLPKLTERDRQWLSHALFLAGLCWLIRILITAVFLQITQGGIFSARLTFNVADSVLPYPLVMVPYLLFANTLFKAWQRWLLLVILVYTYVWIGYRIGLVLMSVPFAVYFLERLRRFNLISIMLVVAGFFLFYKYGVFGSFGLTDRFADLNNDALGSRQLEWAYALDSFRESPIIGKGVGWQVPTSITFFGVEDTGGPVAAYVGYVHSSFAYMAMTLGVIGIALYFFFVLPRPYLRQLARGDWFAFLSLMLLVIFCLTQASYRTIQVVLLMIVLIRLNTFDFMTIDRNAGRPN